MQRGSTIVLAGTLGRRVWALSPNTFPEAVRDADGSTIDPSLVHRLAMKALDAARAAGAIYADVRLTRTMSDDMLASWDADTWGSQSLQYLGLGVRALVNGYWGFAGTPYWTPEEAVRVAASAVAQATTNAKGPPRSVDWGRYPVFTSSWVTPITLDPFRIPMEEKLDFLRSVIVTARRMLPKQSRSGGKINPGLNGTQIRAMTVRQECALATTEGSYITQTIYQTLGAMPVNIDFPSASGFASMSVDAKGLTEAGRGWEMFHEAKLLDQLPGLLDELESKVRLPFKPVELGRYDLVCDARTMAGVLDATLGRAAEVDRALGYEANAAGTSYLGPDPMTVLGTTVASKLVTVTGNRSMPAGLATVKWDAEGVTPEDFTLVHDGTLVDYHTTREQAAWLAPWYQRAGTPIRSHGCAQASDASSITLQMQPNLTLAPGPNAVGLEDLIATISDGIVVEGGRTDTDFQCRNGMLYTDMTGQIFQVKRGKRVAQLADAGILFNSLELWKNIKALGGSASIVFTPGSETKGEPEQETKHTVSTVPALIADLPVIDQKRRS